MNASDSDLAGLGWSSFFQSQLTPDELNETVPGRVVAVHRDAIVAARAGQPDARLPHTYGPDGAAAATVGDWLLIDTASSRVARVLDRRSLFKRRAAGRESRVQLIAANVDTLFVVSSCNQDFNVARIERYLALAREAEVEPVVILTKADLTDEALGFAAKAARLGAGLFVETCDARDPDVAARLAPWLDKGQTVALVGSSGVGKSTLVNTLAGTAIATAPIRDDDAKGRHTTTARALHRLSLGAWLLDTPGMRELQLADVREGIDDVFADIVRLEAMCRFSDCRHETEPGCAVQAAIAAGELDAARLGRLRKLRREEALNSASIAERHAKARAFGKTARAVVAEKRKQRGEE